jgi:heptosyltransferase-2
VSPSVAFRAPNWLGDAVLSTVVLPALRRRHSDARIVVLAPSGLGDVFAASPFVNEVVELERSSEVDAYRRGGYDRVLLAPGSWGAAWRAYRGGVRERMGFATSCRGWLLARRLPAREDSRARHQVENYRALAALDGASRVEDVPHVQLREAWRDEAKTLWPANGGARVAFHPGAAYGPAKRWFADRFAFVAQSLEERGASVALVGGKKDQVVVSLVHEGAPRAIDLAGKTRVGTLGALLESADLFITNDTGPMHLAAACGTPTLAIFGSTNPTWTRPYGDGHRVVREETPCSPCYQRDCRFGTPCLERVEAVRVVREALEMIAGRI